MKRDKSRSETDLGLQRSLRGSDGISKTARKLGIFAPHRAILLFRNKMLAEGEGFEPSIRFWRIHTFQACAFNHSATPPGLQAVAPRVSRGGGNLEAPEPI